MNWEEKNTKEYINILKELIQEEKECIDNKSNFYIIQESKRINIQDIKEIILDIEINLETNIFPNNDKEEKELDYGFRQSLSFLFD